MVDKRLALSFPIEPFGVGDYAEICKEAESLGYKDGWSSEVTNVDCFTPLIAAAAGTREMRLGTAICNVFSRGPAALAMSAAGVAEAAPGRFELGIGSGSATIIEGWNGVPFDKPLTRVREMTQFLRRAFAGERVTLEGETFQVEGFRLGPPPRHGIPIHIAALREGMLRLAGEVADGVIINWLSAEDVHKSVGVTKEAARAAGRNPDDVEVTARLFIAAEPAEDGDIATRRLMLGYLTVPVYKAFHQWLGRESLGPVWDAWEAGDRRGAVAAMSEELVDELVIKGSVDEQRAHIARYLEAGVDSATLHIYSFEQDPARAGEAIMKKYRELAPANWM